jgi:hypothetical protein
MRLEIVRIYQSPVEDPKQTEGELYVVKDNKIIYDCKVLELPWRKNMRRISCITAGNFPTNKHISPKFGKSFHIQKVPNRSEILIHAGNYNTDTLGCPLVGQSFTDINKDGLMDVTHSRKTINELWEILPNQFDTVVRWR